MNDYLIGQTNYFFTWYFGLTFVASVILAFYFVATIDKSEYEDEKDRYGY